MKNHSQQEMHVLWDFWIVDKPRNLQVQLASLGYEFIEDGTSQLKTQQPTISDKIQSKAKLPTSHRIAQIQLVQFNFNSIMTTIT